MLDWKFTEDPSEQKLKSYFRSIINLNQILDHKPTDDTLTQVIELNELDTKKQEKKNVNQIIEADIGLMDDDLKEILTYIDPVNLSDVDSLLTYITSVTIKTLLVYLFDQTCSANHRTILDCLNLVIYTIGKETSNYLKILVPALSHYTKQRSCNLDHEVLQLFDRILKSCGPNFGMESQHNIDLLMEIILRYLSEGKLKEKCLDTLIELIRTSKFYVTLDKAMLKFKIQTICLKLLKLLLAGTETNSLISKIFDIFGQIKEYNVFFLHLIIPPFCRLLSNSKSIDNLTFLRGIITYIKSILNFENTLQYTSNIVHSLIKCIQDKDQVSEECKDCLIELIFTFKDHALIYLPLINATFNSNNFRNDPNLKMITAKIMEFGDFEDISRTTPTFRPKLYQDLQIASIPNIQSSTDQNRGAKDGYRRLGDLIKSFNSETVKNLFDISNNFLKEDWEEWMNKACNELLLNSPSRVLACCKSFAQVNPSISKDLLNVGFAMIWSQFNENQKGTVIQNIEKTISNQNVPLSVLKVILNLAEFMEHDKIGLPLDITSMANLAEKCNAHAKALYYRELDFYFSPEDNVESLISLYSNLGQAEAAAGMLEYAKRTLETKAKESWLEALGRWDDALEGYSQAKLSSKQDIIANRKGKIRCYDALTKWELVLEESEQFLNENIELTDISQYAASACIQLGKWDLLEKFTDRLNTRREDTNYYEAIISIHMKDFKAARESIAKSRKYIENILVGINKQTYFNNYDHLVRLQVLAEMEEIIDFHKFKDQVEEDQKHEFSLEGKIPHRMIAKRKERLLNVWADRLEGNEKKVKHWLNILSVRSLLFKKSEMLPVMLRFAKLSMKKENRALVNRIYKDLEDEMEDELRSKSRLKNKAEICKIVDIGILPMVNRDSLKQLAVTSISPINSKSMKFDFSKEIIEDNPYELPPEFYLSKFEKMHKFKELNNEQIYDVVTDFFNNVNVSPELEAMYCRKLGSWLAEGLTEESQRGFDKVLNLFRKSLKLSGNVVETWHLSALTNYKRIQQITSNRERQIDSNSDLLKPLIKEAFNGFMKSISIGGQEFSETLQDTLKLLELWFKYGDQEAVSKIMQENYEKVDITCWLNVVPQMIAKLDIQDDIIKNNILNLLLHVFLFH